MSDHTEQYEEDIPSEITPGAFEMQDEVEEPRGMEPIPQHQDDQFEEDEQVEGG
jgi:hypothetical protein